MKSRSLAISLVILAVATLAPGASAQQPKPGGQIVHGSAQEPDRIWGPVTGLTVSGEISQLVNASLIEINDKLEYAPSLAIEVPTLDNGGISKDGLRYTFKLRPGVKWHDGAPFTSGDVAFTQTVLLNPDVDVRGRVGWNKISRVETPDDNTVIFQFSAIDAPFLDRVAALGILPRHILGKLSGAEIKAHKWFRAPVGTGPFVFKEWVPGSHLVLVKNPSYWKPGKPYLDRIIYKIVPDANALLNQLETGDIDTRLRLVNEHVDVVKKLPNATLVSTPSIVPWLLWINQTGPPFNDKKVRQALAHGFDKERLTKTILGGHVTPAWQLLPPVSWAYNPAVVHHAFDPAKAKALLDEAGWKLGRRRRARARGQAAVLRDRQYRGRAGAHPGAVVHPAAVEADRRRGEDPRGGRGRDVGQYAAEAAVRDGVLLLRPPARSGHVHALPVARAEADVEFRRVCESRGRSPAPGRQRHRRPREAEGGLPEGAGDRGRRHRLPSSSTG